MGRRGFLVGAGGAVAGLGLASGLAGQGGTGSADSGGGARRGNSIAVSTYSFWRFKDGLKLPIEQCIDEAAAMGFDGVEILHMQMENESNEYLQGLKRRALINGIALCGMSTHQGFVSPDQARRQQNIDHTLRQSSWPINSAYL